MPMRGSTVCRKHGAGAPQVRRRAQERLLEVADPVAAKLVHLALHAESEAVQRQACTDLLDRCDLAGKQYIEVTGSLTEELNKARKRVLEEDQRINGHDRSNIAGS